MLRMFESVKQIIVAFNGTGGADGCDSDAAFAAFP
jgi:hypothetical protein